MKVDENWMTDEKDWEVLAANPVKRSDRRNYISKKKEQFKKSKQNG